MADKPLTVADLIAALAKLPSDTPVVSVVWAPIPKVTEIWLDYNSGRFEPLDFDGSDTGSSLTGEPADGDTVSFKGHTYKLVRSDAAPEDE